MSVLWLSITLLFFALQFNICDSATECIQRHPISREILDVLYCEEGCCGKEHTYQVCCEALDPDRFYTQYDYKKGLSPIHWFLIVLGCMTGLAGSAALIFCIIRCSRSDKRECSWI